MGQIFHADISKGSKCLLENLVTVFFLLLASVSDRFETMVDKTTFLDLMILEVVGKSYRLRNYRLMTNRPVENHPDKWPLDEKLT